MELVTGCGDLPGGDLVLAPDILRPADNAAAALQGADAAAGLRAILPGGDGCQAAGLLTAADPTEGEAVVESSRDHVGINRGNAVAALSAAQASADAGAAAETCDFVAGKIVGTDDPAASGGQQNANLGAVVGVLDGIMDALEVAANRWAAPCQ
jgi:hypothetical protein